VILAGPEVVGDVVGRRREYGATVGETRPEEPGVLIVPRARVYDLVPVCELPYGPRSFIAAPSEAGQMTASDHVPIFFKNRLHLAGRPQMSTKIKTPWLWRFGCNETSDDDRAELTGRPRVDLGNASQLFARR
jgi:hypothetical protein